MNPLGIFLFMLFTPNISAMREMRERDGGGTKGRMHDTDTETDTQRDKEKDRGKDTQRERLETTEAIDQHLHLHLEIVALSVHITIAELITSLHKGRKRPPNKP